MSEAGSSMTEAAVRFVMRVTFKTREQVLAMPARWIYRIVEEWA